MNLEKKPFMIWAENQGNVVSPKSSENCSEGRRREWPTSKMGLGIECEISLPVGRWGPSQVHS